MAATTMIHIDIQDYKPTVAAGYYSVVLRHSQGTFPTGSTVCHQSFIKSWARDLNDFIRHQDDLLVLKFMETPYDVRIVRREARYDVYFCSVPYALNSSEMQRVDVLHVESNIDIHHFARQLALADASLQPLEEFEEEDQDDRLKLGALTGLNAPPTIAPTLTPIFLDAAWDTLVVHRADTFVPSDIRVDLDVAILYIADGVEHRHPLSPRVRNVLWLFSDTLRGLQRFWMTTDHVGLMIERLFLERDMEFKQTTLRLTWTIPSSDASDLDDGVTIIDEYEDTDDDAMGATVTVEKVLPNVDALDFTRQVIDVARTLLRLLDERSFMTTSTRRMDRAIDELERVVALVQASTPPGNT